LSAVARTPWWIPPVLGRAPAVEPRLMRLLGIVALALFFEQYDLSMLTSALKFIAQDLGMRESEMAAYLGAIRFGSLPAFLVVPFADRIGRREVFIGCVLAVSLGTFATAFAQTALQFVVLQMLTRTFIVAGTAVAFVIVTEEFPAEHRGWAIGTLGALGACGHGLGAVLFAAIEMLPYGWRALYAVGIAPVLLLPLLRREVAETARFRRHRASEAAASGLAGWHRPLLDLAQTYPGRTAGLGVAGLLVAVGQVAVFQFTGWFTQTVHGWSPGQFATMVVMGGAFGIIGHMVAGRLSDRFGRRAVGCGFLGLFPLFAWLFYNGSGWTVPLGWILFVFCGSAGEVILRALSTELFPTAHRSTSAGWLSFVETLGWGIGLLLISGMAEEAGNLAGPTSALALVTLLGGVALLVLPETRRRELEAISEPGGVRHAG
jgi:MFS family permease